MRSRLRPRSKTSFVDEPPLVDGCWIRNDRDGTVLFLFGSASVMKRDSGRVSMPPSRADMVT